MLWSPIQMTDAWYSEEAKNWKSHYSVAERKQKRRTEKIKNMSNTVESSWPTITFTWKKLMHSLMEKDIGEVK